MQEQGDGGDRLLSLHDLERRNALVGAGRWVPIAIVVGFLLALLGLQLAPDPHPIARVVLALGTTILVATWTIPSLRPWWERLSELVATTGVGTIALSTGAADSPLRHLLLFPLVYAAVAQPSLVRVVAVSSYVVAWRFVLVVAEPDVTGSDWLDAGTQVTMWAVVVAAAWVVRVSLSRSTQALSTAQTLRQTLVRGHSDAVYILGEDGSFLEANSAAERLAGVPAGWFQGRNFVELVAPDMLAYTLDRFGRAITGEAQTYETTVIKPDSGERVDLFVTNVRIVDGGDVVGVYGIASDISDRVRDRLALEASERRFRELAESMRDGVFIVRTAGGRAVEFINPAVERITGLQARDLDDPAAFAHHVHEDDREAYLDHAASGMPFEEPVRLRWLHPDGRTRWLELRESPYTDDSGATIGFQGTLRDVTPEAELQQTTELALAREQEAVEHLRQVDRMKNSFLQSVSHELRTPLTSVVGFSQTIRDHREALGPERVAHLLDRTIANAHKLDRMLSDLLDVDRMARGVLTLNLQKLDLHELTSRVLDEIADQVDRPVVVDLRPATAYLDAPKVERVIENLVMNAQRHAPDGTRIWVRTGPCGPAGAELVVEDDGPGVPSELRTSVLEPFIQGPASERSASPGTGIGLALVARFAELHGGEVQISEREGGGASVRVRFCSVPAPDDEISAEADARR